MIFDEQEPDFWGFGQFSASGAEVAMSFLADPDDTSHGNVLGFSYPDSQNVAYLQSATALDLSAWAGGTIQFDMYVISEPANVEWMMKIDCIHPCSSGDVPLTTNVDGVVPAVGVWQTYRFNLDALVASGLLLTQVNTPLVIFPSWDNQTGANFRIDNIKFVRAN